MATFKEVAISSDLCLACLVINLNNNNKHRDLKNLSITTQVLDNNLILRIYSVKAFKTFSVTAIAVVDSGIISLSVMIIILSITHSFKDLTSTKIPSLIISVKVLDRQMETISLKI